MSSNFMRDILIKVGLGILLLYFIATVEIGFLEGVLERYGWCAQYDALIPGCELGRIMK